jgi:hypothetical protein
MGEFNNYSWLAASRLGSITPPYPTASLISATLFPDDNGLNLPKSTGCDPRPPLGTSVALMTGPPLGPSFRTQRGKSSTAAIPDCDKYSGIGGGSSVDGRPMSLKRLTGRGGRFGGGPLTVLDGIDGIAFPVGAFFSGGARSIGAILSSWTGDDGRRLVLTELLK